MKKKLETTRRKVRQRAVFFRLKSKWVAALGVFVAMISLHAEDAVPPVPDVLVYRDGDRVQGRLLRREGDTLVFKSLRFGELRVAVSDAEVIASLKVAEAGLKKNSADKEKDTTVQSGEGSPHQLKRMFHDFFGPWSGRLSFSTQVISDANDRSDVMAEILIGRKWTRDEVSATARYDYSKTNEVDTTDIFRGNGSWRHSLPERLFTVYRPSYEWNRASNVNGLKNNYILLQQEIGVGVKAVDRDAWKVRVGVAENFFNNWDLKNDTQRSARIESLFFEADLKLPWRIMLSERAVYFYSFADGHEGWEHRFEITKKLTDTLSLGLRQEVRYNDPDIRTEDYSLLRFLIGLDF